MKRSPCQTWSLGLLTLLVLLLAACAPTLSKSAYQIALERYDGLPSANLEPLDDEGRAKVEEAKQVAAANQARLIADTGAPDPATAARLTDAVNMLVETLTAGKKPKA